MQPCLVSSSLWYDLIILHAVFVMGVLSCMLIAEFLLRRLLCNEGIEDSLNLSKDSLIVTARLSTIVSNGFYFHNISRKFELQYFLELKGACGRGENQTCVS